jgi:glucosamine--fructose-6-phosphate aminotransferase (isomerizing)
VLGVVNVVGSTIARECDGGIYMHAGPEVAVASTKAFTCSLVAFALLALHLGRIRDPLARRRKALVDALERLPERVRDTLGAGRAMRALAERYAGARSAFFVGRAGGYPIALEGAQKMKEISYIHAEAYPASELKHGPLALITEETPVFVVLPHDALYEKTLSTIEEVRARRGPVIAVTHAGDESLPTRIDHVALVPELHPVLDPILLNLPFQVLAYDCAVALGRDVDQPRNLAKSVTVE